MIVDVDAMLAARAEPAGVLRRLSTKPRVTLVVSTPGAASNHAIDALAHAIGGPRLRLAYRPSYFSAAA